MDYTKQSLFFKIRKTLRYLKLYGPSRTLIKIKGQYHFRKKYETPPTSDETAPHSGTVGIIGCGNYAFSNIAYYLKKNFGNVIRACMDPNIDRAASLLSNTGSTISQPMQKNSSTTQI